MSIVVLLGGMLPFTWFFVQKLKEVITKGTGAHFTSKIFVPEIVMLILADPEMKKVFTQAIDAARKQPVSRFRFLNVKGLVQKGTDMLRFAMCGQCPGHTTMRNDLVAYVSHIGEVWIPNGATYDSATILSPEEQEQSAREEIVQERASAEEAERVLDAKVTDAIDRDDHFVTQALAMLSKEFPQLSEVELNRKFAAADYMAETTGTQVFKNFKVLHVRAMREGVLIGFLKAMITEHEIFTEYAIIPDGPHCKGLAPHLFEALVHSHQHVVKFRAQVLAVNSSHIAMYEGNPREAWRRALLKAFESDQHVEMQQKGKTKSKTNKSTDQPALAGMRLVTWVTPVRNGKIWGTVDVPQTGAIFMAADVKTVHKAVEKSQKRSPLALPIEVVIDGLGESAEMPLAKEPGSAFENSRETEADSEEPPEQQANALGKGHWGAKALINVLTMLLVAQWTHEVMLPGSNSQFFLFKLTCDAARLMNAPRKFRVCTTVIAQLVSAGVKGPWGTWGASIVEHMVEKPQSSDWAFCVATWFGKDDRPNVISRTNTSLLN